jgi:hypothetical protein
MTFDQTQNREAREAFIKECRQNAWGHACHADYVAKSTDKLIAEFAELKRQDDELAAEAETLAKALDYHTVENREKRKTLQDKRAELFKVREVLSRTIAEGNSFLKTLYQKVDSFTSLAEHAEKWTWPEGAPIATENLPT